jgi:hypothetical protein
VGCGRQTKSKGCWTTPVQETGEAEVKHQQTDPSKWTSLEQTAWEEFSCKSNTPQVRNSRSAKEERRIFSTHLMNIPSLVRNIQASVKSVLTKQQLMALVFLARNGI